jgi:hypothetical protein
MKTIKELEDAVKLAREHKKTAEIAHSILNAAINSMPKEGFTSEFLASKIKDIREKHTPAVRDALNATIKVNDEVRSSRDAWSNREFVLSMKPVTESLHPFAPAKDPIAEAHVRQSKMNEYARYPKELLKLHAEKALKNNELGNLFLLHIENQSRATQPGFEPLDLSAVKLPDQDEALSHLKEIEGIQRNLENTWRDAEGFKVTPAQRISAARMGQEV